jgi:hypothetical protein
VSALTPHGILSVGQAMPSLSELEALAKAAQALARAQLTGKLAGAASIKAKLALPTPPTLAAAAALKAAAALAVSPGLGPTLQIEANAGLVAALEAQLAGLTLPDFGLGAFGVAGYSYEGSVGELGGRVSAALNSGLPGGSANDVCYGVLLVATAPEVVGLLKRLLVG